MWALLAVSFLVLGFFASRIRLEEDIAKIRRKPMTTQSESLHDQLRSIVEDGGCDIKPIGAIPRNAKRPFLPLLMRFQPASKNPEFWSSRV